MDSHNDGTQTLPSVRFMSSYTFGLHILVNTTGAAKLSDVCWDYCNGGCSFQLMPADDCASGDDVTVLARCEHSVGYAACHLCQMRSWAIAALESHAN